MRFANMLILAFFAAILASPSPARADDGDARIAASLRVELATRRAADSVVLNPGLLSLPFSEFGGDPSRIRLFEDVALFAHERAVARDRPATIELYAFAYDMGTRMILESAFGTSQINIMTDVRSGRTTSVDIPVGLTKIADLRHQAARDFVALGMPNRALEWLHRSDVPMLLPRHGSSFTELELLRELIEDAASRDDAHSEAVLRQFLFDDRAREATRSFERALARERAARNWIIVFVIGCVLLVALISRYMMRAFDYPDIPRARRPRRFEFCAFVDAWEPDVREPEGAALTTRARVGILVLMVGACGLLFFCSTWTMGKMLRHPTGNDAMFFLVLTWILFGIGAAIVVGAPLVFSSTFSYSKQLVRAALAAHSHEHACLLLDELDMSRDSLRAVISTPWFWRDHRDHYQGLFAQLHPYPTSLGQGLCAVFFGLEHMWRVNKPPPKWFEQLILSAASQEHAWMWRRCVEVYVDKLREVDRPGGTRAQEFEQQLRERALPRDDVTELADALARGDSWTCAVWRERFAGTRAEHAVVWSRMDRDGAVECFRVDADGTLIDADLEEVRVSGSDRIAIAHPGGMSTSQVKRWVEHLTDFEVIAPIGQFDREPRVGAEIELLCDVSIGAPALSWSSGAAKYELGGWRVDAFAPGVCLSKEWPHYGVVAIAEGDDATLRSIRFEQCSLAGVPWHTRELDPEELDPRARSEILFDLELSVRALVA